jgi:hypothetical protein
LQQINSNPPAGQAAGHFRRHAVADPRVLDAAGAAVVARQFTLFAHQDVVRLDVALHQSTEGPANDS